MVVTCSALRRGARCAPLAESKPQKRRGWPQHARVRARRGSIRSRHAAVQGAQSMARVVFTPNIQRHVALPQAEASGRTVRDVLEAVFADHPQARGYVLDDQSALRKHITIFVDGRIIHDRTRLTDAVSESSTVYVFQALSGG